LEEWTQDGKLQPEVANKVKEWFSVRTNPDGSKSEGLGDWDISRDAPYFGIEIPDAPGKYFYVWLDAPIGYLASLKNLLEKRAGENYDAYMANPAVEQYHFIGKDIVTFHTLFWPSHPAFQRPQNANNVFVHGFLTVNNGEKMSKSRGTGLDPLKYLSLGMNPEWLRYYLAAKFRPQ
jgi:methionyl-tRNA synthetase